MTKILRSCADYHLNAPMRWWNIDEQIHIDTGILKIKLLQAVAIFLDSDRILILHLSDHPIQHRFMDRWNWLPKFQFRPRHDQARIWDCHDLDTLPPRLLPSDRPRDLDPHTCRLQMSHQRLRRFQSNIIFHSASSPLPKGEGRVRGNLISNKSLPSAYPKHPADTV